jgi:hypothetical protein
MKSELRHSNMRNFSGCDGRGTAGCLVSLTLLLAATFISIKVAPLYYSYSSFESGVKTEASRAGAHFFDDETIIKDVLDLAKRNEIRITRESIKIDRFAGQIHIFVAYEVPVDFVLYQRNLNFEIKASSLIGAL